MVWIETVIAESQDGKQLWSFSYIDVLKIYGVYAPADSEFSIVKLHAFSSVDWTRASVAMDACETEPVLVGRIRWRNLSFEETWPSLSEVCSIDFHSTSNLWRSLVSLLLTVYTVPLVSVVVTAALNFALSRDETHVWRELMINRNTVPDCIGDYLSLVFSMARRWILGINSPVYCWCSFCIKLIVCRI